MTADDDRELAAASGAYALHALDRQEEREVEALLSRSPGLREEVTGLADTAVELGLALRAEEPPADLRARLLAAVATTPQLHTDPARAPEPPVAPVTSLAWYRRPVGALLTAAAAVLVVAGVATGAGLVQSAASASQIAAIAAASDARHTTAPIAGGGTARIVWSDALGRSGMRLTGVPALDLGRTYQLWYIHGATARSAGVVAASGDVMLTGSFRPGDTIGVTVEPAGGSAVPTTKPILAVATS